MSILHINHIKNDVLKYFDGHVDVSDLKSNAQGFEINKLSRSLSAYAIYSLCDDVEPSDISQNIIDGSNDNGIDCFYFDKENSIMYFSQAKWDQDGKGEPSLGDIKKFTDGVRDLVNFRFERFNNKLNNHRTEIEDVFSNPNVKYKALLVHTGANELAELGKRELEDLINEMNDASEIFSYEILNQTKLHSRISKKLGNEPINEIIELKNWGKIDTPVKAFYGQVNGYVLANFWEKYSKNLFSKNIRNMLGDSDVNSEIKETILEKPEYFWYYNNGITIIADKITKTVEGGGNTDIGKFSCENISIINGAQTVSTIGKAVSLNTENVANTYVQCRIIESGSISNELSEKITKTNNRQNKIENRDFASQDEQQKRIRDELLPEGYNYIIQRIENYSKDEYSIDLQEATTALVCAGDDITLVVQLKREIGKLWEDISKLPYLKVFNASTNSLFLLRAVLIQRKIDATIASHINVSKSSGYDKAIYSYGNRIIAAKVFSELPKKSFSKTNFDISSLQYDFDTRTKEIHSQIINFITNNYPNAMIPPFFKNFTKCAELFKNI